MTCHQYFLMIQKQEVGIQHPCKVERLIENSGTLVMATAISADTAEGIWKLIDDACGNEGCLLCASAIVVCKWAMAPAVILSSKKEEASCLGVAHDSVHWLASCTKSVTGVACMQLVEESALRLNDSDQAEQLCPELAAVKIAQNDGSLEKEKPDNAGDAFDAYR